MVVDSIVVSSGPLVSPFIRPRLHLRLLSLASIPLALLCLVAFAFLLLALLLLVIKNFVPLLLDRTSFFFCLRRCHKLHCPGGV